MEIKLKIEGESNEVLLSGDTCWKLIAEYLDVLEISGFNVDEYKKCIIPAKKRQIANVVKRVSCEEMKQ